MSEYVRTETERMETKRILRELYRKEHPEEVEGTITSTKIPLTLNSATDSTEAAYVIDPIVTDSTFDDDYMCCKAEDDPEPDENSRGHAHGRRWGGYTRQKNKPDSKKLRKMRDKSRRRNR